MKFKRIGALLLAIAFCAGTLVGCSGDDELPVSSAPAVMLQNSGEDVTIVIGEIAQDAQRTDVLREIADKYQADFSNTKVEIVSFANSDEIENALVSGKIDIAEVTSDSQISYVKDGLLYDFYEYLPACGDISTLTPAAEFVLYSMGRNHAYLFANDITQTILYYRSDLFDDYNSTNVNAKISFRTWEQIAGYMRDDQWVTGSAQALDTNGRVAFAGSESLVDMFNSVIWSAVLTGRMSDPSVAHFSAVSGTTTVFELEQADKAVDQFEQIVKNAILPESLDFTEEEAVAAFCNGEAAMLLADRSYYNEISAAMPKDSFKTEGYPRGLSGTAVIQPKSYLGWGISSKSENVETALHFLTFLSNADNNTHYAKMTGAMPIHLESVHMEESLSETNRSAELIMANRADWYQFGSVPAAYKANDGFEAEADKLLRSFIDGETSKSALLEYFATYWASALNDEGALWQ